jgi:hypothetical protein
MRKTESVWWKSTRWGRYIHKRPLLYRKWQTNLSPQHTTVASNLLTTILQVIIGRSVLRITIPHLILSNLTCFHQLLLFFINRLLRSHCNSQARFLLACSSPALLGFSSSVSVSCVSTLISLGSKAELIALRRDSMARCTWWSL